MSSRRLPIALDRDELLEASRIADDDELRTPIARVRLVLNEAMLRHEVPCRARECGERDAEALSDVDEPDLAARPMMLEHLERDEDVRQSEVVHLQPSKHLDLRVQMLRGLIVLLCHVLPFRYAVISTRRTRRGPSTRKQNFRFNFLSAHVSGSRGPTPMGQ